MIIQKKRRLSRLYKPTEHSGQLYVPESTLHDVMKRIGDREPTLGICFPQKQTSLLSNDGIDLLQDIIRKRDQTNNGVSRAEAISIILDLGQAKSMKTAENHLDYLIRKGSFFVIIRRNKS